MSTRLSLTTFRPWRHRALVAALCLGAQLFAVVHLFALHHVRCAEHGDLLHVEGDGSTASTGTPPPRANDGPRLAASNRGATGHQGDHCTTLGERKDLRTHTPRVCWSLPLTTVGQAPPLLSAPAPSRALYRIAPKISPPRG